MDLHINVSNFNLRHYSSRRDSQLLKNLRYYFQHFILKIVDCMVFLAVVADMKLLTIVITKLKFILLGSLDLLFVGRVCNFVFMY